MSARERSNVRVGLAAVVACAIGLYLAFGGSLPFQHPFQVRAVLSSATQLHGGSPVRIAGINVGQVTGVRRGPGSTALVTMRIADRGLPLHRDATLKVRPRLFLEGNFFVDLRPGTPQSPVLRSGGTIPLAQTAVAVQLDQVLSALKQDTRAQLQGLVGEYATALRGGGAQAINRTFAPSAPAFKGVAVVAQAARGLRPGDLRAALRDGDRITAALASRRQQLASLVTAFARTSGVFAAHAADVQASLTGLARTLRVAPPALAAIDAALPETRAFAAEVRPLLRRAPGTLDLAEPLLAQVSGLIRPAELPALARSLRRPVAALAAIQPRLRDLLGRVTPVTDCVRRQALPVLDAQIDDGPLSTHRAVWQELTDSFVGLASSSQDFDANGPWVRYLAGFGEQLISTGQVPGFGALQAATQAPLEGSRPKPPATGQPPFRPDVPCADNPAVNLTAAGAPAP
jgi:virulence factor Mce-like protein